MKSKNRGGPIPARAPRGRRGFSLVENMIAMMIVALGYTATMTLINMTRFSNETEQERARAHQIVSGELELIQRDLYTYITSGRSVTVWDNGTPDDTSDDSTGTLEVIVRDPAGTLLTSAPVPPTGVQVEVTLTWNPRGRLKTKTLRETVMTYVAP